MITISVIVVIIFVSAMAWAGYHTGYEQGRIDEYDRMESQKESVNKLPCGKQSHHNKQGIK